MNLPHNLQLARVRAEMTQEVLAEKVGTSKTTICQYETGYRTPSVKRLSEIADVLGTTVSELTK